MNRFAAELNRMPHEDLMRAIESADPARVSRSIDKESPGFADLLALLSPAAEERIERLALKSKQMTERHFGRNINLYIPLYISNECGNECAYCGFNRENQIERKALSAEEIKAELNIIRDNGFSSILILTGEHPARAGVDYIAGAVEEARKYFSQVSLEVFPLSTGDYKKLVDAGATGLTIYQETYDRQAYGRVHLSGKKQDFEWRLSAPERAAEAGFRNVGIGALLGLADWRAEAACLGAHAKFLMKKFWRTEIGLGFPRLRESSSRFAPQHPVTEKNLAQMVFALRLYTEFCPVSLSTRESRAFRDAMIGHGVTHMSAGSRTNPGGYGAYREKTERQFEVSDDRDVNEIAAAIRSKGHYPVFRHWSGLFGGVSIDRDA